MKTIQEHVQCAKATKLYFIDDFLNRLQNNDCRTAGYYFSHPSMREPVTDINGAVFHDENVWTVIDENGEIFGQYHSLYAAAADVVSQLPPDDSRVTNGDV